MPKGSSFPQKLQPSSWLPQHPVTPSPMQWVVLGLWTEPWVPHWQSSRTGCALLAPGQIICWGSQPLQDHLVSGISLYAESPNLCWDKWWRTWVMWCNSSAMSASCAQSTAAMHGGPKVKEKIGTGLVCSDCCGWSNIRSFTSQSCCWK